MQLLIILIAMLLLSMPAWTVPCNNQTLKQAVKQYSEQMIINLIASRADCTFDIGFEALDDLKKAGVSDKILEALTAKAVGGKSAVVPSHTASQSADMPATAAVLSGVYIVAGDKRISLSAEQIGTGSSGFWDRHKPRLLPGSLSMPVYVPGSSSQTTIDLQPLTIVVGDLYQQHPVVLIRAKKLEKNRRVLYYMKGMEVDRDEVSVTIERVAGEVRLKPKEHLEPGQYAIVQYQSAWTFGISR